MSADDSAPTVRTHPDADALAHSVAVALVHRLATWQAEGREPAVALTGGTIAERIHALVPTLDTSSVDWTRVTFWWGDERYVAADSDERNDRATVRDLLEPLGVPAANVHRMPTTDDGHADVDAAAAAYADEVRSQGGGGFDLVMLGVGPDGHVASLFPGFAQLGADDLAVGVTGSPKPPPERVTLTFAALERTEEVWFLVSGEAKADAVRRALAEDGTVDETPARGVRGGDRTWWLDADAASLL
ncbi:6-phosphogluconolactonase [Nocardioides sp. CFH 31398]|uniref:6-phosphogluconolactonase n=1 Tax=Nocardioides sp. CFH 31398 TaxID=2919579 RepID=UPI001F070142|nr:6-phosphogluconolactonase [Nocardioides sp. CFH 31398]MCH1866740.1 6-phosphogluconolactonase [Nocardioides sp. CFH 31398]